MKKSLYIVILIWLSCLSVFTAQAGIKDGVLSKPPTGTFTFNGSRDKMRDAAAFVKFMRGVNGSIFTQTGLTQRQHGVFGLLYKKLCLILLPFVALLLTELLYFSIARKHNIVDRPNHRSSHYKPIICGGGIIFTVAIFITPFYSGWTNVYFLIGLFLISLISFIDDIKPVSNRSRIIVHLTAVALVFYQVNIYGLPFYWTLFALFLAVGAINAINFMDGINGITASFGLVTLGTLLYINTYEVSFTNPLYLLFTICGLLVFSIFNLRTRAKSFAGDVGSIGIAFIIVFLLLQLIIKTSNFSYLLLLLVYGLDTATTILFRIARREQIFSGHRSHYYQFLANEQKMPHLAVSGLYALVQLMINVFVVRKHTFHSNPVWEIILSAVVFLLIRFITEGPAKLLRSASLPGRIKLGTAKSLAKQS